MDLEDVSEDTHTLSASIKYAPYTKRLFLSNVDFTSMLKMSYTYFTLDGFINPKTSLRKTFFKFNLQVF